MSKKRKLKDEFPLTSLFGGVSSFKKYVAQMLPTKERFLGPSKFSDLDDEEKDFLLKQARTMVTGVCWGVCWGDVGICNVVIDFDHAPDLESIGENEFKFRLSQKEACMLHHEHLGIVIPHASLERYMSRVSISGHVLCT